MTVDDRLNAIFRKAFNVERLSEEASPATVGGWDSMGHLSLITELEAQFSIQLTVQEWREMVSVRAIKEVLGERGIR